MEYLLLNSFSGYDTSPVRNAVEAFDVGALFYLVSRYGPSTLMAKAAVTSTVWFMYQSYSSTKPFAKTP
jgi:hypothetical protein